MAAKLGLNCSAALTHIFKSLFMQDLPFAKGTEERKTDLRVQSFKVAKFRTPRSVLFWLPFYPSTSGSLAFSFFFF